MSFAFATKIPTEKIKKLKKTTFTGLYFGQMSLEIFQQLLFYSLDKPKTKTKN